MEESVLEELVALESIFYDSFCTLDGGRFRVRIDPETCDDLPCSPPTFILEIGLPSGYPKVIPEFMLNNINNYKYVDKAKEVMMEELQEQAKSFLGESMCYSLIDWLKQELPRFYDMRPKLEELEEENDQNASERVAISTKSKGPADEKMTKAQKRRFYDRFGASTEKPRGWNWVCITSHVSQSANAVVEPSLACGQVCAFSKVCNKVMDTRMLSAEAA